jgi:hypothetical protein
MKPIHKLNNGNGATLCHTCSVIISTGLTKELYCNNCKQETLEEAAQRFTPKSNKWTIKEIFIEGAKWQQERSYSDEDIKTAFFDGWQLREEDLPFTKAKNKWFKQFKNK